MVSALKTNSAGQQVIDTTNLQGAISDVQNLVPDALFYRALAGENPALVLNLQEDIQTSLFSSSWIVFEQVTKDIASANYATRPNELSVSYQNNRFQFTAREKKDIELFYYIRNAIQHYNGAYYAAKDIDHRYSGTDFRSSDHHGEKISMSIAITWKIALDLERYTLKAWSNAKNFSSKISS